MKVVGIVGYQGSGKTKLVVSLSKELSKRGYEVATLKHTRGEVDLPDKDTAKHKKYARSVGVISLGESAVFFKGKKSLEDILSHLKADFYLLEGFKEEKTYPKIICLSGKDEDKRLFDGLEISVISKESKGEIKRLANLVEERAFKLPNLNCKKCGFKTCYGLACQIVKGKKTIENCVSLRPTTEVEIDGELVSMNPFISSVIRNTIKGMLSPLKGYREGKEIKIKIKGGSGLDF